MFEAFGTLIRDHRMATLTAANAVTWISRPFQCSILCCLYAIPQILTWSLLARHILSSDDIKCFPNLYHIVRPLKPRRRQATLLNGCVSRLESLTLSLFQVDDPNCIGAHRLGCGSRDSTTGPASLGWYIATARNRSNARVIVLRRTLGRCLICVSTKSATA